MARVTYVATFRNPDGSPMDDEKSTFEAPSDADAKSTARGIAQRMSRSGTITWTLKAISGRDIR